MKFQISSWHDIALPVILLLTGIVLLGGDFAGFLSLDRIANLWPCAFILAGLVELSAGSPNQPLL